MISAWAAPETATFCTLALVLWGAWIVWMLADDGVIEGGE